MRVFVGTSGFSYAEWKGSFYPAKLPAKDMLAYYATQLGAVEINNTFYRLPRVETLEQWRSQVPSGFRFAVKASRRITHIKRLADCSAETEYLLEALRALGEQLGSVLFQTPPHFRLDVGRLGEFLASLPSDVKTAFEFRHDSWLDERVFSLLRDHNCALVASETDERSPQQPWTADWAYLRLRKTDYHEGELAAWASRLRESDLKEAQIFFKHEDEGTGPKLARAFMQCWGSPG
jgi:uncharacterized protein YecE (DUF72 family)